MIVREVLPIPFKETEMSEYLQLLQLRLKVSDSLETLISSSPLEDSPPGFSFSPRHGRDDVSFVVSFPC